MSPRIDLDDSESGHKIRLTGGSTVEPEGRQPLANPRWESPSADDMVLFVTEEPCIGHEFVYNGVPWRIVDYRDGWVAVLVVD